MSDQDFIEETGRRLAIQQDRVAQRVGQLTGAGWDALPTDVAIERMVERPHFTAVPEMLEWGPRQIVGHLRDNAQVQGTWILQLRNHDDVELEEFDSLDDGRLAEYQETSTDDLTSQLTRAQLELRDIVASVEPGELDHRGVLGDRQLTLRDVLELLVEHEEDHADQLAAVTAESMA